VVIGKTISVHTKLHVTLDTFEHHRSSHAPHWTHVISPFRGIAAMPVLIVNVSSLPMLVFDSETTDRPISRAKPHAALRKTVAQLLG